jgi:hypothetical protein
LDLDHSYQRDPQPRYDIYEHLRGKTDSGLVSKTSQFYYSRRGKGFGE